MQTDSYICFETKAGILCYDYGPAVAYDSEHIVGSAIAYEVPYVTNRRQEATGRYFEKLIFEGNEGDLQNDFAAVPDMIRGTIRGWLRKNPYTNERALAIPKREIITTYNSKSALHSALREQNAFTKAAVRSVLTVCEQFGIPQKDIGLYGSLQYGIVRADQDGDVDLLIYGLHNYPKLVAMVAACVPKRFEPSKYESIASHEIWRAARLGRQKNAKLSLGNGISADLKMVRYPHDSLSFDFSGYRQSEFEPIELEARVIRAEESLTYPSIIEVTDGNSTYLIVTRLYIFVGAATKGDIVRIKGIRDVHSNTVLITDSLRHYVYATSAIA